MSDFVRTGLIFLIICSGLAYYFRSEIDRYANGSGAPAGEDQQNLPDAKALAEVYAKLKIKPLEPVLLQRPKIATALHDLADSFCDKTAIYRLSNELLARGAKRTAAEADMGFAETCPNSEGERYAAANILFGIGDYAAALPIADSVVAQSPSVSQYYYTRGQVRLAIGLKEEAIEDFTTAIGLVDDLKKVSSSIFSQLASAYAATSRFCQAMTAIQTYVYADPQGRDTASARRLISEYQAKGLCDVGTAKSSVAIPRTHQGVTVSQVKINGHKGLFIVDTGASLLSVSQDFARKAGLPVEHANKVSVHTANGTTEAILTTADAVEVGAIRADHVATTIISSPLGDRIDGLLGMSFLARFDVTINAKEIRIEPRHSEQPPR